MWNGFLYIVGGRFIQDGDALSKIDFSNKIYKFEITAEAYTIAGVIDLPHRRACHASVVVGNYLFIYGGSDGMKYHKTAVRINLAERDPKALEMKKNLFNGGLGLIATAADSDATENGNGTIGLFFGGLGEAGETNEHRAITLA